MKTRTIVLVLSVALACVTVGGAWLSGAAIPPHQIGPNTANPAYIVVSTSTPVTFTSVIADSTLWRHDPLKVLLVRTEASGKPIDIVGRMLDNGRRADSKRNDHTYTIRVNLNEATVGPIYFRVAAKFREPLFHGKDDDDDWDRDLSALNDPRVKSNRRDRLSPLLRRLAGYTLSDPITLSVWDSLDVKDLGLAVAVPAQYVSVVVNDTDNKKINFYRGNDSSREASPLFFIHINPLPQNASLRSYVLSFGIDATVVEEVSIAGRQYLKWREDLGDGMLTISYSTIFSTTQVITLTLSSSFAANGDVENILKTLMF